MSSSLNRRRCLLVRDVVERLGDGDEAATVRRIEAVEVVIEWPDRIPGGYAFTAESSWRVAELVGSLPQLEVLP